MHLYSAAELRDLLPGCAVLALAGSNVSLTEGANDDALADPAIWATVVDVERSLNQQSGLVDSGSHLILAARRLTGHTGPQIAGRGAVPARRRLTGCEKTRRMLSASC